MWRNDSHVVLPSCGESCGQTNGAGDPKVTGAASYRGGEAYSQRVAKVKPTAMKAMPTNRFFCPRSVKTAM